MFQCGICQQETINLVKLIKLEWPNLLLVKFNCEEILNDWHLLTLVIYLLLTRTFLST